MIRSFQPLPQSHPDALAAAALKNGLRAPKPSTSRVLELGCADGANLIPMAFFLPEAHFVGVDEHPDVIESARGAAGELGVSNIEFRDWSEFAKGGEDRFDYILASNHFSFVSEKSRQQIWAAGRSRLSENGVLLLRYCAEVGWILRSRIARLVRSFRRATDTLETVSGVREFLAILDVEGIDEQNIYAKLTRSEIRFARSLSDDELELLFINDDHRAYGFQEFCDLSRGQGFNPFEEAALPTGGRQRELALRRQLFELVGSYELVEEALDTVTMPTFRNMLLCRSEAKVDKMVTDQDVLDLGEVAAELTSRSDDVLLDDGLEVAFKTCVGSIIRSSEPKSKAILGALKAFWPQGASFDAIVDHAEGALAKAGAEKSTFDESSRDHAAQELVALHTMGIVSIRSPKSGTRREIENVPRLLDLTRWQAQRGSVLTNAHHGVVHLDEFARLLLLSIDGERTRAELEEEMKKAFDKGLLEALPDPETKKPVDVQTKIPSMVSETLAGLGHIGLFRDMG